MKNIRNFCFCKAFLYLNLVNFIFINAHQGTFCCYPSFIAKVIVRYPKTSFGLVTGSLVFLGYKFFSQYKKIKRLQSLSDEEKKINVLKKDMQVQTEDFQRPGPYSSFYQDFKKSEKERIYLQREYELGKRSNKPFISLRERVQILSEEEKNEEKKGERLAFKQRMSENLHGKEKARSLRRSELKDEIERLYKECLSEIESIKSTMKHAVTRRPMRIMQIQGEESPSLEKTIIDLRKEIDSLKKENVNQYEILKVKEKVLNLLQEIITEIERGEMSVGKVVKIFTEKLDKIVGDYEIKLFETEIKVLASFVLRLTEGDVEEQVRRVCTKNEDSKSGISADAWDISLGRSDPFSREKGRGSDTSL